MSMELPVKPSLDEAHRARRVELILQQLEALPTLSTVAVRVLEVTSDDASSAQDVIKLIASDPALAAKVLKLCRCHERGRALDITTIDRAVVYLGFDAVRSAVLAVQVFEALDGARSPGGEQPADADHPPVFQREMFWHHSLAVASLAHSLAVDLKAPELKRDEAFTSGLLHDLGVLALHVIMPRSFDRVCQFAESHGVSLDQACRRIIGLDTHTAGRRLAEHWRLPREYGDVMWLHGQPADSLPSLPHRRLIALIGLADTMARHRAIAPSGHGPLGEELRELARGCGVDVELLMRHADQVHEAVASRAAALGMNNATNAAVLLRAVSRSNDALGRLNAGMRQRAAAADRQRITLKAIASFHDSATPGGTVVSMLGRVVRSAAGVFGGGFFAMLYQARGDEPWEFVQFSADGRALRTQIITPPPGSTAVADLADDTQVSAHVMSMLPWLADYLGDARDLRDVHLLPLRCGWGVSAVLVHDCAVDGREDREQIEGLGRTWAAAIAAAAQHEGAKRLGEQLAEANRELLHAQRELARREALATVGEIAAGAAHEMNNPLTVISGRSQLLAAQVKNAEQKQMASQIAEQAHRLSDLITALRTFAEPSHPQRAAVDLEGLFTKLITNVKRAKDTLVPVRLSLPPNLPQAWIDGRQVASAVEELLKNAIEAPPEKGIELRVQIDDADDRLIIRLTDDGPGLSEHTLAHAFDPFFSAKPAGRQKGLGLPQARRLVEAHGGRLTLENGPNGGATAVIVLPQWRVPAAGRREAA